MSLEKKKRILGKKMDPSYFNMQLWKKKKKREKKENVVSQI